MLKYLYTTRDDGLHYWRPQSNSGLPKYDLPTIHSNPSDMIIDGRPTHGPLEPHTYTDSDWAGCLITRRSFGGICVRLAGGTIAYKAKLQPTVSLSSTEAEFIAANDAGKVSLYVRSIIWDLGLPQHAASMIYEDNDACTAMTNAQKPTPRTHPIDIKYHALCEWVERDLVCLDRVHTSINLAYCFTKSLGWNLFYRHTDFIMGHVPPPYSPHYKRSIGNMIPQQHTTPVTSPLAAAAAKKCAHWYVVLAQ